MTEQAKTKIVTLSNRTALVSGIRKALTDLKADVDKSFVETIPAALTSLNGAVKAVVIVDWDLGPKIVLKFFREIRSKPEREFWEIFLLASEQSEKIIAAGTENGVSKVHTGDLAPTKLAISLETLIKSAHDQSPLVKVMAKIAEAREKGEWDSATKLLEDLKIKAPDNRRILQELAENYLQEGKWQLCYDLLLPFKDATPVDVRLIHSLGKAMIKLGMHKEATSVLQQAKLINPYNVERLIDLGNVLLNLDATKEAEESFVEAERLDPGNKEAIAGRSTAKLMDGEINEALEIMSHAVSGRELASVFNTAAVLSMRLGRFPKGIDLYDAAEKVLQDQTKIVARVLFNKGLGYYRWKKFDEARECFEKAVNFDPDFENARFNLKIVTGDISTDRALQSIAAISAPSGKENSEVTPNQIDFGDAFGDTFGDKLDSGGFDDDLSDDDEHL